jgi:nucleotide-binding universal stress UspA family protein
MFPLSILAVVTGASDDEAVIAVAADLASRHKSTAVVASSFPTVAPTLSDELASPGTWQALQVEEEAAKQKIEALVREQALRFGLPVGPSINAGLVIAQSSVGNGASLNCELPLIDLAITGQSNVGGGGVWAGPLARTLMEARTPVYLARRGISAAGLAAAVAWDGSFEASRAVRAALPLLKDASEVAILQSPENLDRTPNARADPERLAKYLRQRGVVQVRVIEVPGRKIGPSVLSAAKTFGAALLIAGAYHHSRLGEGIFGGATRSFLEQTSEPDLFISH